MIRVHNRSPAFLRGPLASRIVLPEPPATSEWLDGRRYRLAHGKAPRTLTTARIEQGGSGGKQGFVLRVSQ